MNTGTEAEYQSDAGSTKDMPYLDLTGELWGVFCEYLWENSCYNGPALYYKILTWKWKSCYVSRCHKASSLHSWYCISRMIWLLPGHDWPALTVISEKWQNIYNTEHALFSKHTKYQWGYFLYFHKISGKVALTPLCIILHWFNSLYQSYHYNMTAWIFGRKLMGCL